MLGVVVVGMIWKIPNLYTSFLLLIYRQFIARTILDTLRLVTDTPEDVEAVLKVMNKLADDVGKSCWWM